MTETATPNLMRCLYNAFNWLECRNLRVGRVWLNEREMRELFKDPAFDRGPISTEVMKYYGDLAGGFFMGSFGGAEVFQSKEVPPGHIALAPADLAAKLVGSAACMSLAQFKT